MNWQDRIKFDPAVLVGRRCSKGTRISVELSLEHLAGGWTSKQILAQWDHIGPDDICACIAYAGDVVRREYERSPSFRAVRGRTRTARPKSRRDPSKRKSQRRAR